MSKYDIATIMSIDENIFPLSCMTQKTKETKMKQRLGFQRTIVLTPSTKLNLRDLKNSKQNSSIDYENEKTINIDENISELPS